MGRDFRKQPVIGVSEQVSHGLKGSKCGEIRSDRQPDLRESFANIETKTDSREPGHGANRHPTRPGTSGSGCTPVSVRSAAIATCQGSQRCSKQLPSNEAARKTRMIGLG